MTVIFASGFPPPYPSPFGRGDFADLTSFGPLGDQSA